MNDELFQSLADPIHGGTINPQPAGAISTRWCIIRDEAPPPETHVIAYCLE